MLKQFLELKGTAKSGDRSLWLCHTDDLKVLNVQYCLYCVPPIPYSPAQSLTSSIFL